MKHCALSFNEWPDGVGEVIAGYKRRAVVFVEIDLGEACLVKHLAGRTARQAVETVHVAEQVKQLSER
ncbi:hypothetical protein [Catenulispora sp. GAS73]|uniref:hypothetical protein n=1 Tax=Catenulispora sp. GAS73 TaxID=3156269 RepID=UPI003513644C